jgi:eukaryotic-like serine/threonine-protein kinase
MSPGDNRRATALFGRLRELPENEREAALDSACGGDAALRAQVLLLIEADRHAAVVSFPERHSMKDAPEVTSASRGQLPQPGALIGSYRLGEQIGIGGMGVVFEGEDLRLGRRVAIKILTLPLDGVGDEPVQRFRRESRAASLLNHPNIVSIFDAGVDTERGSYYIVTEFIEGRTLREILNSEPQSLDKRSVVDILTQTASALGAAHEAGIIHRDIKPENIMLRPDGIVKVLDFGLAKLRERQDGSAVQPPELRTRPGHLAGTIHYLSPEQAAGRPMDSRSDLFSLGVVAYELATGQRPFEGVTDGAIYNAILRHTPAPPSVLRPAFDTEFDNLVMRAIEKDPELRFQTAADLRSACKLLERGSSPSGSAIFRRPQTRRFKFTPWIAVGAVLSASFLWTYWRFGDSGPTEIAIPVRFERLTDDPGEERFPNLSPDGGQFIYSKATRGNWDIYLKRTGGMTAANLTENSFADDTEPALSQDGGLIAFRSERDGGGLFMMEATGENPRRVSLEGHLPSWSPDGRALVYSDQTFQVPGIRGAPTSRLHIIELQSGRRRTLPTGDAIQPRWSPHGHRIAYWGIDSGGQRDLFTIDARGDATPVPVTQDTAIDWNPVWSPSGEELFFISNRSGTMSLWRVRIDERSGRILGPPEPIRIPAESVGHVSFSASGNSFVYSQIDHRVNLFRVGFDPSRLAVRDNPMPVGIDGFNVTNIEFSPDQQRIVYDTVGEKVEDLWVMNIDGSGRRRLTSDPYKDRGPAWSPRGEEIAFYSDRTGRYELWMIRPDGSGMRQLTSTDGPEHLLMPVWSRDGRLLFAPRTPGTPVIVDPHRSSPVREPQPAPGLDGFDRAFFAPAPDRGEWMLIDTGDPALPDLWLYSYAGGKMQPLGVKGRSPVFLPGSQQIIYARETSCFIFDIGARREHELFSVAPNEIYMLAPKKDGQIYFTQTNRDSDLWIARMK